VQGYSSVPKRRWFQFHLMTAILVMLLAGALSWANSRMRPVGNSGDIVVPEDIVAEGWLGMQWGWPFCFYERVQPDSFGPSLTPLASWPTEFHWQALAWDILIAVAILLGAAFLCEAILRRAAARSSIPE
jgi:hypothetical protein